MARIAALSTDQSAQLLIGADGDAQSAGPISDGLSLSPPDQCSDFSYTLPFPWNHLALSDGIQALPIESRASRTDTWLGGTGDWTDGADWSAGREPQYGDAVIINAPDSVVTLSGAVFNGTVHHGWVASITISSGAELELDNTGGKDTVSSYSSSAITNAGTFGLHDSNGQTNAINAVGGFINSGNLDVDNVTGHKYAEGGSSLTISHILDNTGNVEIGNTSLTAATTVTLGSLTNASGANFDVTGSAGQAATLAFSGGAKAFVENAGNFELTYAAPLNLESSFTNDGTFGMHQNTSVTILGGFTNNGTLNVDNVTGQGYAEGGSSLTITGALDNTNTVQIGSTSLTAATTATLAGLTNVSGANFEVSGSSDHGATLTFSGGANSFVDNAGNFELTYATPLNLESAFTNSGTFGLHQNTSVTIDGGFTNSGTLNVDNVAGQGYAEGGSSLTITNVLDNTGSVQIGSTSLTAATIVKLGGLSNASGSSFDVFGSSGQAATLTFSGGADSFTSNAGDFELTYAAPLTLGSAFTNSGTFGIHQNTSVTIDGGFINNGNLNVDNVTGFQYAEGGSSLTIAGVLDNTNTVQVGSANLTAATTVTLGGLTNASGANFVVLGSSDHAASVDISGASAIAGTLDVGSGAIVTFSGSGSTISGTISGAGTLAFTGGSQALNGGASLTVANWTTSGSDALNINENLVYDGAFAGGGGTTLSISSNDTLTFHGAATLAGSISGAGTLALSGGTQALNDGADLTVAHWTTAGNDTVTVNETLSYDGTFSGGAGTTLDIGSSGALTFHGTSTFAGSISGAGTLVFSRGTDLFNTGASFSAANLTIDNVARITVSGNNVVDSSTTSQTSGTAISIGTGAELSLSGSGTTIAGTISGAGTLAFAGGSQTLDNGASITVADWTISNGDAVTVNDTSLRYGGTFSAGAATSLVISSGAMLTLKGGATFLNATEGAGTLAFAGGTQSFGKGATLTVANWTTASGDTLNLDGNLSYGGTLSSAGTINLRANRLDLDGKGSSISGAIKGTGILTFSGGSQTLDSGASLAVSHWKMSGSDALSINENLVYGGAFAGGGGTTLSISSNDTLTFHGTSIFAGSTSGAGTLALAGGTDAFNTGASFGAANLSITGGTSITVSGSDVLDSSATSQASGTTIAIGLGDTLTLSGAGSSMAGTVSGAGTLAFSGGSQTVDSGASLTVANWTISDSDAVTVNDNLTYAGVLSEGAGTTLDIGANTLTLSASGTTIAGTISGAGTLAFAGGSQTLNDGARFTVANWTLSNGDAVTVTDANLSYGGTFSANAGTSLVISSGAMLTLSGAATFLNATEGAGTLAFAGGTQTFGKGATLTVANWTTASGDTVNLDGNLTYGGTLSSAGTIDLGANRLDLDGKGSSISGAIKGTGILTFNGGSQSLDNGASVAVSHWKMSGSDALSVNESLAYGGAFSDQAGTTIAIGANDTLTFHGTSIFAGSTSGEGTLALAGGTDAFNTGASFGAANLSITGGTSITVSGSDVLDSSSTSQASGTTIAIGLGDTLTLSGAGSVLDGAISGKGTLALSGGSDTIGAGASLGVSILKLSNDAQLAIATSIADSGHFTENSGTTISIDANDTLTLSGPANLRGLMDGAGTIAVSHGTLAGAIVGGTVTLTDTGSVTQTKHVTIGNETGSAADLTIDTGASYQIAGDTNIDLGGSSSSLITDNGLLIKSGGAGTSIIGLAIADNGSIEVAQGTLDLAQSVTGSGSLSIGQGATLDLQSSAASTLRIDFAGGNTTLALAHPTTVASTISGFATTDFIDLLKIHATKAALESGDRLVIRNGGTTVATLQLSGNYSGDTFSVASDHHGGTDIGVNAPAVPALTPQTAGILDDIFDFADKPSQVATSGRAIGLDLAYHDVINAEAELHMIQTAHAEAPIIFDAHGPVMTYCVLMQNSMQSLQAHMSDWHFL